MRGDHVRLHSGTAVDSVQSGFDTLVVREACGDWADGPHDAALLDLQAGYADVVSLDDARHYLTAPADPTDPVTEPDPVMTGVG